MNRKQLFKIVRFFAKLLTAKLRFRVWIFRSFKQTIPFMGHSYYVTNVISLCGYVIINLLKIMCRYDDITYG